MMRALFVLVVAVFAISCGGDARPDPAPSPLAPPVRAGLFVIGNDRGTLRPCGCSKPVLGGVERRLAWFAKIDPAARAASVVVSGGDLIVEGGRQQELKLESFLAVADELGVLAHFIGDGDLQVGSRFWEDQAILRAGTSGAALVCANLHKDGRALFVDHVTGELAGRRFAATGFIDPERNDINEPGVEVAARPDFGAVAAALGAEGGCDLLLFIDAAPERVRDLAAATGLPSLARSTLILTPGIADIPVGVRGEGLAAFDMGRKGRDVARFDSIAQPRLERFTLVEAVGSDPRGREILDFYRGNVAFERLLQQAPKLGTAESAYIGSEKCAECHVQDIAIWKESRHAQAWATLGVTGDQADPECVRCHVVDFHLDGGFDASIPGPVDVQCEACHGPGADHQRSDGQVKTPRGKLGERSCLTCHDIDNSPNFKFEDYWPRIEHGSYK